jgi:hypothetical protein
LSELIEVSGARYSVSMAPIAIGFSNLAETRIAGGPTHGSGLPPWRDILRCERFGGGDLGAHAIGLAISTSLYGVE